MPKTLEKVLEVEWVMLLKGVFKGLSLKPAPMISKALTSIGQGAGKATGYNEFGLALIKKLE